MPGWQCGGEVPDTEPWTSGRRTAPETRRASTTGSTTSAQIQLRRSGTDPLDAVAMAAIAVAYSG
jgi:hypothetical protein